MDLSVEETEYIAKAAKFFIQTLTRIHLVKKERFDGVYETIYVRVPRNK